VSQALARARDRFELTPRKLDDEALDRIARGDRGCLGDVLSGVGAVVLVTTMILGAMDIIAWSWAYVGVALWVGGFVLGTYSQARSGKQRKAALESSPLVLATVLRDEAWLRRPGKQPGRAVVLFSTTPERRFDREWLEAAAAKLERQLGEPNDDPARVPLRALLADHLSFGCHRVPDDLRVDDAELWLASVIVHPERLEAGYLGGEDDREAAEQGLEIDGPTRPPALALFVDPAHGFIEQVP
jgi:hypothetical protein